jgi:type I restriction enzyme, S subunit
MSVPNLRFADFSGKWKPRNISTLLQQVGEPIEVLAHEQYREIGVRSHGKGVFHKAPVYGASLGEKRVFRVVPNTLVLNIVFAWEQAIALLSDEEKGFIASHRFPMFTEKAGQSYLPFIREFFLRPQGKALLEMVSPGGAGRNKTLGKQAFLKLKIVVPDRDEQQRIAVVLDAVEARLRGLGKQLNLLTRYKAGLMQQLFSQSRRFSRRNGKPFPEWKETTLGEIFAWIKTNNLSREYLTYEGGTVQNIHYGDIHTKFRANFRQSYERVPFICDSAPVKISDEEYCRVGDVVIADASEDYADIGKAVEIVEVAEKSMVAGLHTYIARPIADHLAVGFSGYLLRSASVRKQIVRLAQGISVLGVSKGNLSRLKIRLPHPDEQRQIAAALSALDERLDAVTSQVEGLANFKKGLLRQMFV